ncbi:MAG: protein kinase [Myxococcota bacterium]
MTDSIQLGAYRLVRRIGAGGMAEVFLAERVGEAGFARTVALKTVLTAGDDDEAIQLFLDEARVASELNHTHIVQTLDLGFINNTLFIVMEYVQGPSLSRVVRELKKRKRFMPPEAVAFIGAKVASALHYAWATATASDGTPVRMVHRDISPQNIMITRDGLVKLSDFGVARASIQTHRTRTGQVRGKAAYMAPEQVRARPLDGRTDVFSLCLVLYEALTAKRLYGRPTDIQSMRAVLDDPVPSISERNPSVTRELERIVLRGLEKKPQARWPDAMALQRQLESVYADQSVHRLEQYVGGMISSLFPRDDSKVDSCGQPYERWQPNPDDAAKIDPQQLKDHQISTRVQNMLQTPSYDTPASLSAASDISQSMAFADLDVMDRSTGLPTATVTAAQPRPPHRSALLQVGVPVLLVTASAVAVVWNQRPQPAAPAPASAEPTSPLRPSVSARPTTAAPPSENREASSAQTAQAGDQRDKTARADDQRDDGDSTRRAPPPSTTDRVVRKKTPQSTDRKRPSRKKQSRDRSSKRDDAPGSFQKRILAAKRAHEKRGDQDMVEQLTRLLLDLSMREATPEDRAVLKAAERALR